MPAVVGQRGVIEEVRLDHPIHLHVLEMVGDALEESLANISVVRRGIRLSVVHRGAALRPAAVSGARPVVLVIGIADREFAVERVIDAEQPSSDVDLVIVVRVPAKAVGPHTSSEVSGCIWADRPIECRDVGNRKGRQRAPQRVVGRDDVRLTGDWETRGGVESVAIADRYDTDQPRGGRVKDFALVDRPIQRIMPYDIGRLQYLWVAEVSLPLGSSRKSIDEAGVDRAVIVEAVHVNKPKSLAAPGNLRNRPACGSSPVILGQGEFLAADCIHEEIPRVQLIAGEEIVYVAVQLIGAGFRGVGDKTTAGVPVLCGKGVLDDRHLLYRGVGYRALLRPLVTFRITEGRAVKPIFSGHRLAAVDPRRKLAAAEDRVAIRLHWHKARLQLQQGLGKTNVSPRHPRKIAIVGGTNRMRYRGILGVNQF